jgi:hypothetical protein
MFLQRWGARKLISLTWTGHRPSARSKLPIALADQKRLNREQDHDGEHRASDNGEG